MGKPKTFDEEQAINKALQLFWYKGYEATSMQDIVDTLGLNRSSIYHTFSDKRTLFLLALKLYQQQQSQHLLNFLAQAPPSVESFRTVFGQVVAESLADTERKGCFMVNTSLELANRDPEIQRIVLENNQRIELAFAQFLERMRQAGTLSTHKNIHSLASFLMSGLSGLRVSAVVNPDRTYLMNIVDGILAIFK